MVVEMKSSYKEENAGEGRSLRSRRVNYAINEKTAIKKKIKSCSREVPLEIKMEKGNNLRIFCSTTAFENIRKIIIETVASNYVLEMTENKDISERERVIIETIKTKERNARRALPIFIINIYRTTSTTNKWTPSTEICARDITSTTIMGRSERKGNRHM